MKREKEDFVCERSGHEWNSDGQIRYSQEWRNVHTFLSSLFIMDQAHKEQKK
jgi:hypothetical protein